MTSTYWERASAAAIRTTRLIGWRGWLVVVGTVTVMFVLTMRRTDGFVPDSRYYLAMALDWSGKSQDEAARSVQVLTDERGWAPVPVTSLFGWDLVEPRIVYPLLSVPFVAVFGIGGMHVIPVAAMVFVLTATLLYGARHFGPTPSVVVVLLVSSSFYMVWFGTSMLTESLSAAFVAGILLTLPISSRRSGASLVACGVLVVAVAFTRQAALLPAAGVATAWLFSAIDERSVRTRWAPFAVVSVSVALGCQAFQAVVWSEFSARAYYRQKTGTEDLRGELRAIPSVSRNIVEADLANYLAKDRAFLLVLLLAMVGVFVVWRRPETHLMIGSCAVAAMLNVLNTTPTNFRYAMPALPFVMVAVMGLLSSTTPRSTARYSDRIVDDAERGAQVSRRGNDCGS